MRALFLTGIALLLVVLVACATSTPATSPSPTVTVAAATAVALATETPSPAAATASLTLTSQPPAGTPSPAPSLTATVTRLPVLSRISPTSPKIATRALSPLPSPTRPPPAAAAVSIRESVVMLAAYPYADFLKPRVDPATQFPFLALDWGSYQSAAQTLGVKPKPFKMVLLENEYLRVTFLPDLGGRLYQITYKPTGQNLLYNNHVLKPTVWGPANQSGWLAAGGIEWALPVNEHGYEWGVPWSYSTSANALGATITLVDTSASDRVRARITVTLPAEAAYISVRMRIENPTGAAVPVQFWNNAMLSLGSARVSPNVRFVLPTDSVFVHSTADPFIPDANIPGDKASSPSAPIAWPSVGGVDLSHYGNWPDYLGVFAGNLTASFAGAYNDDAALGIARVFPPAGAPGVKLFGWGPKMGRSNWTEDGSDYVELWGGLPRTFFPSDDVTLGPGEGREWTEYWAPFAGTGGLSAATRDAVLSLQAANGQVKVGALTTRPRHAVLVLNADGAQMKAWNVYLGPGSPFSTAVPTPAGSLKLRLLSDDGTILAETN